MPKSENRFVDAALRQSYDLISRKIKENFSGFNLNDELVNSLPVIYLQQGEISIPQRTENAFITFELHGGGLLQLGALEKHTGIPSLDKRKLVVQIKDLTSRGEQIALPPVIIGGYEHAVDGIEAKLTTEQIKDVRRSLAFLKPQKDVMVEGLDWKDLQKMKALSGIGIESESLLWSEKDRESHPPAIGKIMEAQNMDQILECFPQEELIKVFGKEYQQKVLKFLVTASIYPPTPSSASVDSFSLILYETFYGKNKRVLQITDLHPNDRDYLINVINFGINNGILMRNPESDVPRVIFNPHVTQKIRSFVN